MAFNLPCVITYLKYDFCIGVCFAATQITATPKGI